MQRKQWHNPQRKQEMPVAPFFFSVWCLFCKFRRDELQSFKYYFFKACSQNLDVLVHWTFFLKYIKKYESFLFFFFVRVPQFLPLLLHQLSEQILKKLLWRVTAKSRQKWQTVLQKEVKQHISKATTTTKNKKTSHFIEQRKYTPIFRNLVDQFWGWKSKNVVHSVFSAPVLMVVFFFFRKPRRCGEFISHRWPQLTHFMEQPLGNRILLVTSI